VKRTWRRWLMTALLFALTAAVLAAPPAKWAQPIELAGVPNLHRVSETLYRSAQPTAEGMRALEKLGIRTVVNLRAHHSDADELSGTMLREESIPVDALHPRIEDLAHFLRIVNDPQKVPVLVHCQRGADRTGLAVAVYRVAMQDWTKEEAIREMTEGGFQFNAALTNLPKMIEAIDVAAIRRQAGMP